MEPLRVTILPELPGADRTEEAEMVKTALFFGDEVLHISPLVGLADLLRKGQLTPIDKAILLLDFDPSKPRTLGNPLFRQLSAICSRSIRSGDTAVTDAFQRYLGDDADGDLYAGLWLQAEAFRGRHHDPEASVTPGDGTIGKVAAWVDRLANLWNEEGVSEQLLFTLPTADLEAAEATGLIEIRRPELSEDISPTASLVLGAGFEVVIQGLNPTGWPLLSSAAASAARVMLGSNDMPDPGAQTAAIDLARHILGALPKFEAASIQDVAGMRDEISSELATFRAEMMRLAETSAIHLGDPSYDIELRQVFDMSVAPMLRELDQLITAKGWRSLFGREAFRADASLVIPAAAITTRTPELLGLHAGLLVGKTLVRRRKAKRDVKSHGLALVQHLR